MTKNFILTLGLMAACAAGAWAQTFSGGDGTATSPYQLKTVADIAELATQVNAGTTFSGQYVQLAADITYATTDAFTPIGTSSRQFLGTFDGQGHTVKNVVISGTSNQGFFANVGTTGVVKNVTFDTPTLTVSSSYGGVVAAQLKTGAKVDSVTVKNATVTNTAGSYKGGLVGFAAAGTTIEHSSFSGSVTTATSWGCIVGQNYGKVHYCWSDATVIGASATSTSVHLGGIASVTLHLSGEAPEITDCYFLGTIQGSSQNNVGGISATLREATMERCWNAGYLQSSGYDGGLVGNFSSGVIKDCYNTGTVYDTSAEGVGGLVGYQDQSNTDEGGSTIENCLSLGSVYNSVLSRTEGCELVGQNSSKVTLKNVYFDSQVAGWGSVSGGMTTSELTTGTAISGFSTDVWQFTAGMYPRLKGTATLDVAVLNATPFFLATGETHSKVKSNFTVSTANDVEWQITGTTQARLSGSTVTVTRGSEASGAVLHSYLGDYEKRSLVTIYPVLFSGTGTEADPYLIATYDDLKKLSDATNDQELDFRGEYFKVTADIDMQADTSFVPVSAKQNFAFSGTFDGQGHAFKNWKFDNVAAATLNKGLFGFLGQYGTIKDVTIDKSCQINAYRNFGAIAAYSYGTIDGCKNYATVHTSAGYAAGIVYIVEAGEVKNCLNAGDVISASNAGALGGITYSLYDATVSNCQNSGRIEANFEKGVTVGGVVGYNRGTVTDVLNTGTVVGYSKVGGLVGESYSDSKLSNALSVAPITYLGSSELAGAVAGSSNATATYSNVVYDSQIAIYKNIDVDGITGRLTSEITAGSFGGDLWTHTAGSYPVLASFATEAVSVLGAAPVTFIATDTREQVSAAAQLANVSGLTWAVAKGDKFGVSGSTLTYAGSDSYVTDTLTATYQGLTKVIPIAAIGNVLPGSGTEADPYVIATPADLVKVSTTVASAHISFDGKVFSVVADLDMTGSGFTPIATGDDKFQATLKGNGHKISNLTIESTDNGVGLVGNLGISGTISDLTIASGTITGAKYVGALAGTADGTITGCSNYATVTATTYVGGIVGQATTNCVVTNSANYGAVTGSGNYTAGIAGYASGQRAFWSGLVNEGNITGTARVAGIVGQASATNLRDVTNRGTITGTGSYVAGIVGYYQTSDSLVEARNDGDISGSTHTGGIVGMAYKSYSYTNEVTVADCYNYGTVTAAKGSAGGIVAYATAPVVERCANVGNVANNSATVSSTGIGAGGIVGSGVPKITDCSNSGTISAYNGVGQILGGTSSSYTNCPITRVVCTGTVAGYNENSTNVGAVVGKPSKYVTYTDVTYDKQMCNLAAAASADAEGVTAALTTQIAAPGEAWTVTEGGYPCIASLSAFTPVKLSSLAVKLDTADTRYAVTKHFTVTTADNCAWTGDEHFYISEPYVSLAPNSVGDYTITVSSAGYKHDVVLSVNAPDGSTGVSQVKTDAPVTGRDYYDVAGRRLAQPAGLCIEVTRYADGTSASRKISAK